MAILTTGVSKTPSTTQIIEPITDTKQAVTIQQQALQGIKPTSLTESAAVSKQSGTLSNIESIQNQQLRVETAQTVQSSQSLAAQIAGTNSSLQQADINAQVKALATVETRDKLLSAVRYSVDMWRLQAHFCNIQIMGQTATGGPGCLQGPDLKPWITQAPSVYNTSGYLKTLSNAVADAVSMNFKQWQDMVTVPGLPWYPMLVAVAAPFAPPVPNIPMSLMVCVSQNFAKLATPSQLDNSIQSFLPAEMRIAEMTVFTYMLSAHLVNYFMSWLSSQNVMMVMGMGPVPAFNPPYVPVGPVVNGYVIPSPGHLAF